MSLPATGMPPESVLAALEALRVDDPPVHGGRVLAYVYDADVDGLADVGRRALAAFGEVNGLDPTVFRSGREFAAWLGLVPRQNSTGGKTRLGRTSRQGNAYLRRLLVVGAQSALFCSKAIKADPWVQTLLAKRPRLVVAVALANKMARIAWALMARQTTYRAAAAA